MPGIFEAIVEAAKKVLQTNPELAKAHDKPAPQFSYDPGLRKMEASPEMEFHGKYTSPYQYPTDPRYMAPDQSAEAHGTSSIPTSLPPNHVQHLTEDEAQMIQRARQGQASGGDPLMRKHRMMQGQ